MTGFLYACCFDIIHFIFLFIFLFFLKCSLCEGFSLDYKDDAVDSLLPLKDRLENPDHSVLYKACSDLTKVHFISLCKNVRKVDFFNLSEI